MASKPGSDEKTAASKIIDEAVEGSFAPPPERFRGLIDQLDRAADQADRPATANDAFLVEQEARLRSSFPESFAGPELEYSQLEELIDKHPRRTVVEVYRRFVLQPSFAAFFRMVFARGGLHVLQLILPHKRKSGALIERNDIDLPVMQPTNGAADKDQVPLAGLDDQVVIEYVAQCATADPQFASRLKAAFDKAERRSIELPSVAPKLWADRPAGMKATEFVAEYYRPWIEAGVLTLLAIKECDPALYDAYRVRVHRKPEEAVALAEGKPKHFIADPQEAIDRVRRSSRESIARVRAARRDNLARSPD